MNAGGISNSKPYVTQPLHCNDRHTYTCYHQEWRRPALTIITHTGNDFHKLEMIQLVIICFAPLKMQI